MFLSTIDLHTALCYEYLALISAIIIHKNSKLEKRNYFASLITKYKDPKDTQTHKERVWKILVRVLRSGNSRDSCFTRSELSYRGRLNIIICLLFEGYALRLEPSSLLGITKS
jgi:hypothetical protein